MKPNEIAQALQAPFHPKDEMTPDQIAQALQASFHPKQVHWWVGSKTKDGKKGMLLAYIDARDVMDRLDAVVGPEGWQDTYEAHPSGQVICSLVVDYGVGRPTTKTDASWTVAPPLGVNDKKTEQRIEMAQKGVYSDAFKRAAVKHGIGRYLYDVDSPWVEIDQYGNPPKNFDGSKYLPTYRPWYWSSWMTFTEAVLEHAESIKAVKAFLLEGNIDAAKEAYQEIPNEELLKFHRAYTKGGVFTTEETAQIRNW